MPKKVTATSFIGGGNLVVYKDSKNKDLAWKFVQYLTDPKTSSPGTRTSPTCPLSRRLDRPGAGERQECRPLRPAAQGHQGAARDLDLERAGDRAQRHPREDDHRHDHTAGRCRRNAGGAVKIGTGK